MNHLSRLGDSISIAIEPDKDGFTGRECPNPECEGYFKIEFGTGLRGEGLPCHCPYCGHTASHDQFWTKEQLEYARSVALRTVTDALHKELKKLEFDYKPRGPFGIGLSVKVRRGSVPRIRHYREKMLETEIVCSNCTLRYAVYGVFAFCPDCGLHNSLQILTKNLELAAKMLDVAVAAEPDLEARLIEDALEDCVSSFDGFGREICHLHAAKATNPVMAQKVSFQSLEGSNQKLSELFNVDIAAVLTGDEWKKSIRAFQKRHLLAHKMGAVDEEYIHKAGDGQAEVGRKVTVGADEVRDLIPILLKLAQTISDRLAQLP
jgi:hypothetical protein